jgi:hypothetical protein
MNKIFGSALSVLVLVAAGCNRGQVTPVAADSRSHGSTNIGSAEDGSAERPGTRAGH